MSLQWFEPYILGEVSFGLWLTASLFNESHELYMISYPYSLSFFYDVSFFRSMADYLGTFRTIELVSYASPVVMIIYTLTPENKGAFGFLVCGQFALWGANYCLYPPIAAFLFGEENMGTNYGFIFFVFGVCSTFLIDICGYTSIRFEVLNLTFAGIGFALVPY